MFQTLSNVDKVRIDTQKIQCFKCKIRFKKKKPNSLGTALAACR